MSAEQHHDNDISVLIITYWFEPQQNAATERIRSWINHLPQSGIKVTFITYDWSKDAVNKKNFFRKSVEFVSSQENGNAKIIRLNRKVNFRDFLFEHQKLYFLRKILSFFYIFLEFISYKLAGIYEIYRFTDSFLQKEKINLILTTGGPFPLFRITHHMSKKYNIPWIADYRDGWSTAFRFEKHPNVFQRIEKAINQYFEKKWTRSAASIITVSEGRAHLLQNLLKRPVHIIYNGFEETDFKIHTGKYTEFTISYTGTLYNIQDIQIFINGLNKLIEKHQIENIRLLFAGLIFQRIKKKINKLLHGRSVVTFESWQPRTKILEIMKSSHLLLYVGWPNYKGILSAKIFEYIASETPILLCPGDNGELDRLITNTGTGYIANTSDDVSEFLEKVYFHYKDYHNEYIQNRANETINEFNRENQSRILAGHIINILQSKGKQEYLVNN